MNKSEEYAIFDAYQVKGFGGESYETDNLYVRFYTSKKLFWTNYYVPYGPICKNQKGFDDFIEFIMSKKLCRFHIDFPLIYDEKLANYVVQILAKTGFKSSKYILDEETILVNKNNFSLNKRNLRYVRQGEKKYDIQIQEKFSQKELLEIYELMKYASESLGYNLKPYSALEEISENALTSVATNKSNGKIEGFLMGFPIKLKSEGKIIQTLQLMFTGLSSDAKHSKLGFALHDKLFHDVFDNDKYDLIDFHGASRTQNRSYIEFKKMFGGEFKKNLGSYQKFNFF